jgi:PPP family 3-phenylpropionic acid transporter
MRLLTSRLPLVAAESSNRGSSLWVAKLYYLFFFGALGALAPFFNVYLRERGLTGAEIGVIASIPPLVALTANPFWSAIADRWQIHQVVLACCALVAGLISVTFGWLDGFWVLLLAIVLMVFFRTPVPALLDSAVMDAVKRTGASYGRQRLFGSLGFLTVSYGMGQLLTSSNLEWIFVVHGVLLAVGCALLSLLLPVSRIPVQGSLVEGLRGLINRPDYVAFTVMNVFMGIGAAAFINFIGLRILALGGTEAQVGLGFALNALFEVPILFMGARLMRRFSIVQLIVFGLLGFATVYFTVASATSPTVILVAMPALGLFYASFWMAVVVYANESAPAHLRATGQSLVGAAQSGLGWAIGSILSGLLWDATGGASVFVFAGVSMLIGATVFLFGQRGRGAGAKTLMQR